MLKKILLTTFVILSFAGGVFAFLLYKNNTSVQNLISPIFHKDFTDKIITKIDNGLKLDFNNAKELPSLSTVPRYLVYNSQTGKVYYSKQSNQRISPASFTKLLSAQVALDFISADKTIVVHSESLNKVPTVLGLKAGEEFLVFDILRGAIATSGNDAAQVLADESARSISATNQEFLYYMNKKAELIGMAHSHFTNPDGLDDQNQYSTLEDIAKLVNNVQKNYPEILRAAKSDMEDIATGSANGYYYLPNWNGLLNVYPGVDGLKIAYTEEAGYSTIVTYNDQKLSLVAIVSGTDSYLERDRAAADLLDAALIANSISPKRVSTSQLNLKYKQWGDLARKIRQELKDQGKL